MTTCAFIVIGCTAILVVAILHATETVTTALKNSGIRYDMRRKRP